MEIGKKIIFGDFGIIFFLHLILIVFFYLSPFFLSWKIILFFLGYIYLQEFFLEGCVLSFFQFGSTNKNLPIFHNYYLEKLGINVSKKNFNFTIVWVVPLGVFIFSLVWQTYFSKNTWLIF